MIHQATSSKAKNCQQRTWLDTKNSKAYKSNISISLSGGAFIQAEEAHEEKEADDEEEDKEKDNDEEEEGDDNQE